MKRLNLLWIIFVVYCLFCLSLNAQTEVNDLIVTPRQIQALEDQLNDKDLEFARRNPVFMPIKAHLIRRDDGTGGLSESDLNDAIALLNFYTSQAGVNFFLCNGINYIDNSDYYTYNQGSEETQIANQYEVSNVVNIYFADRVLSSSGSFLCGYAYYPGGPLRIVMANNCATNPSTLTHEIGHFFGLFHTHGNNNDFNSTEELADGSNGATTGDLIEDTASDPNVLGLITSQCVYTGNALDNNGQPHVPDPLNLMSYSRKACRNVFSPLQLQRIYNVSTSPSRSFLECSNFNPNFSADNTFSCIAPLTVQFSNESEGDIARQWDFDGDGVIDSTADNPIYTYEEEGEFDVTLRIYDGEQWISKTKERFIVVGGQGVDTQTIELEMQLDKYPSETDWRFTGTDGTNLSGGDYNGSAFQYITINETFEVLPGFCYTFTITDTFGDGLTEGGGFYKLRANGEIIAEGSAFGILASHSFKVADQSLTLSESNKKIFRIYPNPLNDVLNMDKEYEYVVYDITGKLLLEGSSKTIKTTELQSGIYLLKIGSEVIKFIKK